MIDTSLYCFRWIMEKITICWKTLFDILNQNKLTFEILKILAWVILIGIGFKIITWLIGQFTDDE